MSLYRSLVAVPELGPGVQCADNVREPILAWKVEVETAGGILHCNRLYATIAEQQVLRDKYVAWLNAGKPVPEVAAANKPGRSAHNGGCAIDVNTFKCFPNAPADKQIDLLWSTGAKHGWTPIISKPDESMSERWHFDHKGDWSALYAHQGYGAYCLAAALDVGNAGEWQTNDRLIQALLLRAGFDIGTIDGVRGKRTNLALQAALGMGDVAGDETLCRALRSLPAATVWRVIA